MGGRLIELRTERTWREAEGKRGKCRGKERGAIEENRQRRRRRERVQAGFTEAAQRGERGIGGGVEGLRGGSLKGQDNVKVHLQMFPRNNLPVESTDPEKKKKIRHFSARSNAAG